MNRQTSWGGGVNSWSLNTIGKGITSFTFFVATWKFWDLTQVNGCGWMGLFGYLMNR